MTGDSARPSQQGYRIEGAREVGGEYMVKLAILTEYEFPVVAGHVEDDAIAEAQELALYSDLPEDETSRSGRRSLGCRETSAYLRGRRRSWTARVHGRADRTERGYVLGRLEALRR